MVAGRKIKYPNLKQWSVLLLWLFLLHKLVFFALYFLQYSDHDTVTVWMMATDFAGGNLKSFFFYGQQYNVAFDALLAAPLVAAGMSPHVATALVTFVISTASVAVFWLYFQRNKLFVNAMVLLLVWLCGPFVFAYQMGSGINIAVNLGMLAAGVYLLNPVNTRLFIALFVCTIVGFGIKNALPFAIWMAIYLMPIPNWRKWTLWLAGWLCGSLVFVFVIAKSGNMAAVHPENAGDFLLSRIPDKILHLADVFWGLGPVVDYFGVAYFAALLGFTWYYLRKGQMIFVYANVVWILILVAMMGFDKTGDGYLNAYFPYLRFYSSLLPVLAMNLSGVTLPEWRYGGRWLPWLGVLGLLVFWLEFETTRVTHSHRNLSTGIGRTDRLLREVDDSMYLPLWSSGVTCVSMDDPSMMYAAAAMHKGCHTLYLPYDRRADAYRKFYFEELKECYLADRRVPFGDSVLPGYRVERTGRRDREVYHIKGSGMTGGELMRRAGWYFYLKLD